MRAYFETAKVIGLGVIIVLLALHGEPAKNASNAGTEARLMAAPANAPTADKSPPAEQRMEDIIRIVEYPLRSAFKFPDSVKTKIIKIDAKSVLRDNGFTALDPKDDIQYIRICGRYSAPTPMAMFGPFEEFFARVLISPEYKNISGEVFFRNEGKWKHLHGLDSSYAFDIADKEVAENKGDFCDNMSPVDMGTLSDYKLVSGVLIDIQLNGIKTMAATEGIADFINSCIIDNNEINICLLYYSCMKATDRTERCSKASAQCQLGESVSVCAPKLRAALKAQDASRTAIK